MLTGPEAVYWLPDCENVPSRRREPSATWAGTSRRSRSSGPSSLRALPEVDRRRPDERTRGVSRAPPRAHASAIFMIPRGWWSDDDPPAAGNPDAVEQGSVRFTEGQMYPQMKRQRRSEA